MTVHNPPAEDCPPIPAWLDRRPKVVTDDIPIPWEEPKASVPSTEARAIQAAENIAEAMLEDESDADPLAIKNRANAAIHLCDERNWPEAKKEFAYAAICCEWRWTRENPRQEMGTNTTHAEGLHAATPVPKHTRSRLHDTYDDATPDDLRTAKAQADQAGETVNRRHVRETVESPEQKTEGIKRRAQQAGKRRESALAKSQRERETFTQELLDGQANENAALMAERAVYMAVSRDERDDAMAEVSAALDTLRSQIETMRNDLASEREARQQAEQQVEYWKEYATKIEEALQRGTDG